jgi:hypothetical protein
MSFSQNTAVHQHYVYSKVMRYGRVTVHQTAQRHDYVRGWPDDREWHPSADRHGPEPCTLETLLAASVAREKERQEA